MRVQFLKDTLIGRTTYTPGAGVVEIPEDKARVAIQRGLAVAAKAELPAPEAAPDPEPTADAKPKAKAKG
jgi:hypothetical protein